MTTVPNLNIVIQQGSHALKIHNVQISGLDVSQLAASDQPEREALQRSTVQRFEGAGRTRAPRRERSGSGYTPERRPGGRRTAGGKGREKASGRLVDAYV